MSRLSLIIFLFLSFGFSAKAADALKFPITDIPEELLENAKKVVRYSSIDVTCINAGKSLIKRTEVTTYFKPSEADRYIVIHYEPSTKVKNIKVEIFDAAGNSVRKFKKKDIGDRSAFDGFSIANDGRFKYIEIAHGKHPYTVSYSYEIDKSSQILYPFWQIQSKGTSVQRSDYTIRKPANFDVNFKLFNIEIEPNIFTQNDLEVMQFSVENLPAFKPEPSTSTIDIFPIGMFAPKAFSYEGYSGDLTSWQAYGNFYKDLNEGRDELSPTMKATVKELTADAKTDDEKIEKLYSYLQKNMRYVSVQLGIGGFQTFDAKYVEENKYGDCKALSNFMKAMLKEAGVRAYPVLVNAGREIFYEVEKDFVFPMFNHIILYVPGEDCWLECTSTSNPPGHLGSFTDDRNVLVITENGGEFKRTPIYNSKENRIDRKSILTIHPNGSVEIEKTSVLNGNLIDTWIGLTSRRTEKEIEEFFVKNLPFSNVELVNLEFNHASSKPRTEIKSKLALPRYASKAGKRIFIPIPPVTSKEIPSESKDRKFNFEIKSDYSISDSTVFLIPAGYQLESAPEAESAIESEFGTYQTVVTKSDKILVYKTEIEFLSGDFPPEKFETYRTFLIEINKAIGKKKVVLVKDASIKKP